MVIKTNNRKAPVSDKKEEVINKPDAIIPGVTIEVAKHVNEFTPRKFSEEPKEKLKNSEWSEKFKEFTVMRDYKSKFNITPEVVYRGGEPLTIRNSVTQTLYNWLVASLKNLEDPNKLLMLYYTEVILSPVGLVITNVLDNFNKFMLGIEPNTKDGCFVSMPNRDSFKQLIIYALWHLDDNTIPKGEENNELKIEDYLTDALLDSVADYLKNNNLSPIELLKHMLTEEEILDISEEIYVGFFINVEESMDVGAAALQLIDLFKEQVWDNLVSRD